VPGFVVKNGRERPRAFELTEGAMEIVDWGALFRRAMGPFLPRCATAVAVVRCSNYPGLGSAELSGHGLGGRMCCPSQINVRSKLLLR
jgi:hypothetical protein